MPDPTQQQPFQYRLPSYVPKSSTEAFPAPTGGWNARDSLDSMDPADAIQLINLFPTFGRVIRRNGYRVWASGLGGPVQTLSEYIAAGTRKFLAAANGKIFDVSTTNGGAVGAALATGFTNNFWQTALFQNSAGITNQIWLNGADAPQQFNGTAFSAATISGTGLTVTNLIGATATQNRVFYWEKASQILWYSALGAIAGVLTAFNLGGLTGFGGNIQNIAAWSRDGGSGPQNYIVIMMTTGDAIVYGGTDISDATKWALVGVYRIGAPIGNRCTFKIGADLAVINQNGFSPLSGILPGLWTPSTSLSDKITFAASDAAAQYHDNAGWQGLLWPNGNMALFNIPISGTTFVQYVMNIATGSWCQFNNINSVCWSLYYEDPYFGGTDGNVYLFWGSNGSGGLAAFPNLGTDNGSPISILAQTAWNYINDRTRLKRLAFVRPNFQANAPLTLGVSAGSDFTNPITQQATNSFSGATSSWNVAKWNTDLWPSIATYLPRLPVSGVGNCFSITVAATLPSVTFSWLSITYQFEPGSGV